MKKLLSVLALSLVCAFSAVGFVACDDNNASVPETGMQKVYNLYVAYAEENGLTTISYEEWLATIKGAQGIQGEKGEKGEDGEKGDTGVGVKSVEIDENGNLILTMTDDRVINAGKVKDVHPHEIKEKEIVDKNATCSATGVKYIICETCGELIKTVITDKTPHTYENIVTPATCTEQGYTTHTCKLCGHVEKDTYTAIIPHTYDNIVTPATCTEQGYTTHTCKVCGHVEIDSYTTADTTEHNYVEIGDVYGECALSMQQNYKCTRCNHEKTEKVTVQAPAVHNTLKVGATCEYCGWMVYIKNGDSVLMKNAQDKLSAEFYGTETYKFGEELRRLFINIYLADSVTSIGSGAFSGCSSLTNITIPDSVTSIGDSVFSSCSSLTNITIPDSVTSMGNDTFSGCGCEINWGENPGIKSIVYMFRGYKGTSLTIPNGATNIGIRGYDAWHDTFYGNYDSYPFYGCYNLSEIIIPDSVTSIGSGAFNNCPLKTETESGLIYYKNILLGVESKSGLPQTSFIVREGTTLIADCAFKDNIYITDISLPNSVKSISDAVFYGCSNLTRVTIGNDVTSIGAGAFCRCISLTEITIPYGVTSIGEGAFGYCSSLLSITIPASVSSINEGAMDYLCGSFHHCQSLTNINVSVDNNNYKSIDGNLYSKDGTVLVKYAIGKPATEFTIPNSVIQIEYDAFRNCSNLTSINYSGTIAQWNAISHYYWWGRSTSIKQVICTDGTIDYTNYYYD